LNLDLENFFAEITSLRLMHDDMSAKPCENYNMVMVNYVDLWIVHTQVASQLKGAQLELKELKSNLEACSIEIKNLSTKLIILLSIVFSLLRVKCVALSKVSFSKLPKRTLS
jgi:hypothetical protein